jgi:hypothetical protein
MVENADNSQGQQRKRLIGKPFVKGDPRINRKGAPVRGQSWADTIKRITDMTAGEAIEYVGEKSKVGKLLKELPADLPIKDALVFISIIHYGREPNARMFQALTDREAGKPAQPITGGEAPMEVIIRYATDNRITEAPPSPATDQE